MRQRTPAARQSALTPSRLVSASLAGLVAVSVLPSRATADAGDARADFVAGQPSFSLAEANAGGLTASSLYDPRSVVFDPAGNLYVADTGNHRVLIYIRPLETDRIADRVIGQPDFNSDAINNGGISATSLNSPHGLAVDARGTLWVADYANSRVLQYNSVLTTDSVADRVFGQPDFASASPNAGGRSASSLFAPTGLALDPAGNLYVCDTLNHRVLGYRRSLVANTDSVADLVIGQPSFTSGTQNAGGVGPASLLAPHGVAVDRDGNLWVADAGNHRVLEFDRPFSLGATADRILGQPSFSANQPNTSNPGPEGLSVPTGVAVDPNGNVYVSDHKNNRTLFYTNPIATGDRIADHVVGQPDLASVDANPTGPSEATNNGPLSVAIGPAGEVAIADAFDNRVLLLQAPAPVVTSITVKVSRSGRPKLLVVGHGMLDDFAVVTVDGVPLSTVRYKLPRSDRAAGKLVGIDPRFDQLVPRGVPVVVRISNPDGPPSSPIPFTR